MKHIKILNNTKNTGKGPRKPTGIQCIPLGDIE